MVCRRNGRAAGPERLDDSVEQHVAAPGDEEHVGMQRWSSGQPEADHPGGARDSGAAAGCNGAAEASWHAAGGLQRAGEADRRAREVEQWDSPEIPAACQERPGGPVAYPQVVRQSPAQQVEHSSCGARRVRAGIFQPGRIGAQSQRPGCHPGSFRGRIDADREGR